MWYDKEVKEKRMDKFTSSVEPNRFFTDRSNLKDEYLSPYTDYIFLFN